MSSNNPFSDPSTGSNLQAQQAGKGSAPSKNPFDDPNLGVEPSRSAGDYVRDAGAWGLKAALAVPETAVGLADLATGGKVGKALENEGGSFGLRFKQAREVANDMHSDATKLAQQKFQDADGILDKTAVAVQNPSLVVGSIAESMGLMGAGGVVGRGLMAGTRLGQMGAKGAAMAGAAGEGVVGAGSAAEQIRQETDDGLLTGKQAGLAAATGLATGAIGFAGNKVDNRLGIGDADMMMAQGTKGMAKDAADRATTAAVNPLTQNAHKSIVRQMGEGAVTEGVLEELPQSVTEQILQNEALGKPWSDGLDEAVVMGILSGGTMGAGAAGYRGYTDKQIRDAAKAQQEAQKAAGAAAGASGSADPNWTTSAGAAAEVQPGTAPASPANAPNLDYETRPGAAPEVVGNEIPFEREFDTTGMSLQGDDSSALRLDKTRALARDWDTGSLSLAADSPQPVAPSVSMGLDASRGGLTKAAALAVDSGASPVVQQPQAPTVSAAEQAPVQQAAPEVPAGVDPDTGEITLQAQMEEIKSRIAYVQQQGAAQGWNKEMVAQRNALQTQLTKLEVQGAKEQKQGASTTSAPAPVKLTGINQILAKQIPDMSAGELQQAIAHYGPNHKRTKKLQKALQALAQKPLTAIESGAKSNGTQTNQAQQSGTQPAQTGAAQAEQPAAQGLTDATPAQDNGRQAGATTAPQAQAQEPTREQRAARVAAAGKQWTSMRDIDRSALVARLDGIKPVIAKNIPRAKWDDLNLDIKRKLADAMEPVAQAAQAPAASKTEANKPTAEDSGKLADVMEPSARGKVEPVLVQSVSIGGAHPDYETQIARPVRAALDAGNYESAKLKDGSDLRMVVVTDGDLGEIHAFDSNGNVAGNLSFSRVEGEGGLRWNPDASVSEGLRRKGVATAMYDLAEAQGAKIPNYEQTGQVRTQEGDAFRQARAKQGKSTNGEWAQSAQAPAATKTEASPLIQAAKDSGKLEVVHVGDKPAKTEAKAKAKDAEAQDVVIADSMSRADAIQALEDGKTLNRHGELVWIEQTVVGKVQTYVVKSRDSGSSVVITKGPAGADRQWGWGRGDAAQKAVQSWDFNSAAAEEKPGSSPLVQAMNDLAEVRSKIEDQGQVVDDRLLQRERQLKAVVKELSEEGQKEGAETQAKEKPAEDKPAQYGASNKLVSQSRADELRAKLREKAKNNMFGGLDTEMMAWGTELAVFHLEAGVRKFSDLIAAMASDLGTTPIKLKPYLRSWYNGARDMMEDHGLSIEGMDSPETVRAELNKLGDQDPAPQNEQKETSNERTTVQGDGTQALEPVAAGASQGTEGNRGAGADTAGSGDQRDAPSAGADGAGVQSPRSGGSGTERVHPAEAGDSGSLRDPGLVKKADAPAKPKGKGKAKTKAAAAAEKAIGPDTRPVVEGEPASAPNIPAADFQITDELRLGQGGEVAKFNDNLAAIRTLKAIEEQNRRATPEEQAVLARYVGWGGLANAFPDPLTGQYKAAWDARGKELRDLLDDAEYAAARRSTRNAHYTSKPVVQAMWRAVERLGFKGGLALETSMGVGNFLGLKPQGTPASFVGIEYDSLTARLAQALYPQATVLHSGFQEVPLADNAFALSIGNPPFGSESLRFQYKPELNGTSIHNQFFRASMDALRPGGIQAMVVSRYLMDAKDKSTRLALAKQAKLVAAIRLPDTAFKENARTEVVTDIIILQKLTPAEQAQMALAVEAYQARGDKFGRKTAEQQALADQVPAWVETAEVADPLGGEPMTVNGYFRDNKSNILGVMERSGSMQHGADLTVRLDDPASLESLLAQAVDRLPQNIQNFDAEVIAASEQRHKSMSDALRIALSGQETGHVQLTRDGAIERVVERETPEGSIEMGMQTITANSPWSEQLMQDEQGRWYRNEVVKDAAGKSVKMVKDGKVTRNNLTQRVTYATEAEVPDSLRLGKTGFERLKAAVGLRDSLKRQIVLETSDAAKGVMEANRKELAKRYQAFVAKFGPVNRPVNLSMLMTMPDGGLTAALEVAYTPAVTPDRAKSSGLPVSPEVVKPAPILTERVVPKYEPATKAATASDALAITLSERGVVDMDRIAQLRGLSMEETMAELQDGEKPLVFKDPESQSWETADAYLSGNVRRKLNAAKAARADVNVKALEAVQPAAWGAEDVTVMLGSTWVPPKVYADFAEHLMGGKAKASFSAATNSFSVSVSGSTKAAEWSAEGASADYILGRLLNSQPVVVMYKDENGSLKRDNERTTLAQLKAKEISAEFMDWVFKDGERRTALVDLFNEKYNTRVVRQRDGSHLKLPGKVPDSIIGMRRHQKNVIWRGITDNSLLMDHAVGAGKTFAAIARAMERRRMGLSKKPMIVVPNHLIDQWASDVYRLYPGAKVLAAGKKDFETKRRRRLFGKIATGDWDIVLVPHSSFGFIGIDPSTEQRFLQMEMDQALEAVRDAEEQAAEDGTDNGRRKPFGVKEAERLVEKIQTRMDKLNSGTKDRLLTFEQLGVDDLTVDEAHEFKNLYYSSRMTGVRGMGDKTGSRKANDLYNKVRVLQENPANAVAFLTGTPISNSAVEMFTVMRFLAPQQLKEMGLEHFDAWRAQFVEASAAFEPTESGSLKEVTRLGRSWSNMRSLMDLYYEFTDAVSLEDIQKWYSEDNGGKPFPVPKVKGGDRQLVNVQPTPAQEAMLKDVIAGFDGLADIKDPYERNAERLRLMDRARKVSLDVRAVDPRSTSTEENGKLAQASANIKRIYDASSADKGTQMVFLDRSVPKAKGDDKIIKEFDTLVAKRDEALASGDEAAFQAVQESLDRFDANEIRELRNAQNGGWNAYQQIKENLIAAGIPASEIRFIQEANNDEQKQALFDAVNSGKVRVLLGSSQRMGAGTNAQKRLVGLHHIDVTWKPSDIEQREGRIIRQGNELLAKYGPDFEVEILAYATERTVDAKMWDLNATKLKTINGIRKYSGAFSMDFEDADSVSMAEMAALASGNPLLLERVKTESEINMLELQERAFRRRMYGAQDAVQSAERTIERNPGLIKQAQAREKMARERITQALQNQAARRVTIEGKEYDNLRDAFGAMKEAVEAQQEGNPKARYSLTVDGQRLTNKESIEAAIGAALGDAALYEATINGQVYTQHTAAARELAAQLSALTKGIERGQSRTKVVGKLLGFDLAIDATAFEGSSNNTMVDAAVSLVDEDGSTVHSISINEVPVNVAYVTANLRNPAAGLFGYIETMASRDGAAYMQRQLDRAIADLPALRERLGETFPKAEELAAKRVRLRELVSLLDGTNTSQVQADSASDAAAADGENIAFARASKPAPNYSPAARMEAVRAVEGTADAIRKAWSNGPEVIVAFDMQDPVVPESARRADLKQRSGGARGAPEGFYYQGKVYLMASKLKTPNDAARVLFHETLGHHGLRGLFGKELGQILNQVATMRKSLVEAKVKEYGLRGVNKLDRRAAAEEVLAEMAQNTPQIGFVRRAVAAIRSWLRAHVPGFKSLALTDDELIRNYILPARAWVERGGTPGGGGGVRADSLPFSRSPMKSTDANINRGRDALARAINEQTTVHRAMFRNGLGWVDFVWGSEGQVKASGKTKGAMGLSHILEARQRKDGLSEQEGIQFLNDVVQTIAQGTEFSRAELAPTIRVGVEHQNTIVWMTKRDGSNAWVVTGYEKVPSGTAAGRATTEPTHQAASLTRDRMVGTGPIVDESDEDGNVMFSRSRYMDLKDSALDQLSKAFQHEGKVHWWHKSIGTMRNLAERAPAFKPVYEAASQNIDDVSMLANDAANMAPRILPRVESWTDLKKKPVSAADNKAIAKPLFEGTLLWARDESGTAVLVDDLQKRYANLSAHNKAAMLLKHGKIDAGVLAMWQGLPVAQFEKLINSRFESKLLKAGIVWSDSELKSQFGATDNQISLYRETRAAIDRSIDMTARTDMLRVVGDKYEAMREAVLDQPSVESAAQLLLDTLEQDAKADPDSADRLGLYMQQIKSRMETAVDLQKSGYAPLTRFGHYKVYVEDAKTGESLFFGMYESKRESNLAAMQLAQEFKGATITKGTMSEQEHKLFAGVTPETLEQFGAMLGLKADGNEAQDKAFQEFLKLTKNNHSAMKRLIHRKGTAGFSEDVGRVVASFVYSNARAGAMGLNAGKMDKAIGEIPQEQGELRDLAIGLRSYIRDPQEEGQAVRGMLFAQYLGGSIASAAVNMTQPFQITMPWLSQYGGMGQAARQMARALKDMGTKGFQYEDDLAKALKEAEDDGTVSPQEIHQLQAQARGAGMLRSGDGSKAGDARAKAGNMWEQGKVLWGQPFALAEQFNRRSTFIASYRIAKAQGMADPAAFARKAVLETQFVYSKANKPRWARGAVGGTLFTFKTYSVSYLELMHRMWTQGGPEGKRAVGWALAMLVLMSGAGGLPFMEDAEDLIDGVGQLMGYNISAKQWRKEFLAAAVGKELAEFMEQGISGLPGAPVDVSGRLGLQNLIPGTGLALEKKDRMRDLLEIVGPAGDLVARGLGGARDVLKGALTGDAATAARGAMEWTPTAVRNAYKGWDMGVSGIYKDSKGYKVIDTTLAEAVSKFAGFQPKSVAEVQEANSFMQRSKSFYIQTSSEIKAQWADALFRKDEAALERVRERLADWNRDNPEQPIVVKIPDVMKRVREMGKDKQQRIADTAPKALRAQMREMALGVG